jgi:hypothetical protein
MLSCWRAEPSDEDLIQRLVGISEDGVLWERKFGDTLKDPTISKMIPVEDGEAICSGSKHDDSRRAAWIGRFDSEGIQYREETFDFGFDSVNVANGLIETSDGGLMVIGGRVGAEAGEFYNGWVLKLDSEMGKEYKKSYESYADEVGLGSVVDTELVGRRPESIVKTSGGNYLIKEDLRWLDGDQERFATSLLKVRDDGSQQWQSATEAARSGSLVRIGSNVYAVSRFVEKSQEGEWLEAYSSSALRSTSSATPTLTRTSAQATATPTVTPSSDQPSTSVNLPGFGLVSSASVLVAGLLYKVLINSENK